MICFLRDIKGVFKIAPLVLLLSIFLSSCQESEDRYVIHGDLRCVRENVAYLLEMKEVGELVVLDSVPIRSGEFKFKGSVDEPVMRFIKIGSRPPFEVFVENSPIEITGSVTLPDEIKVSGSFSHDDFEDLSKEYKKIVEKQGNVMVRFSNARDRQDMKEARRLVKEYNSYPDSLLSITKQFVLNNPSSLGAAYFVCQLSRSYDIKRLEEIVKLFDSSVKQSWYVRYLEDELVLSKKMTVGMLAEPFSMPTYDFSQIVDLEDYSGKFLFIDFGASWCVSTSSRTAELKKLKNDFKEKNFEVVSIFLDDDKKRVLNYIEGQDSIPWHVLCDYKYWESPVTKRYRVQSVPYGVLVSPEGRIAMKNPTYKELKSFLRKNAR